MSEHPNVAVINRMTRAVFANDRAALADLFTPDLAFHVRGPLPRAGDHSGVDGFLGVLGTIVEQTGGDVELQQLFCIADDRWGAEWERAVLGRGDRTLEAENSFVYRFEDGRIDEMWMICTAPPGSETFWD